MKIRNQEITFEQWTKVFKAKIKKQGYEQTLVAISWNVLELKAEIEGLRRGK